MSLDLTDDKSTLVQVMDWCRQASSHYLSQCWPRSMSPYGVVRPQAIKLSYWYGRLFSVIVMWRATLSTYTVAHVSIIKLCYVMLRYAFKDVVNIMWAIFRLQCCVLLFFIVKTKLPQTKYILVNGTALLIFRHPISYDTLQPFQTTGT